MKLQQTGVVFALVLILNSQVPAQHFKAIGQETLDVDGKTLPRRMVDTRNGIEFVLIPPGKFVFGATDFLPSPSAQPLAPVVAKKPALKPDADEGPATQAEMSAFYIARTEVTEKQAAALGAAWESLVDPGSIQAAKRVLEQNRRRFGGAMDLPLEEILAHKELSKENRRDLLQVLGYTAIDNEEGGFTWRLPGETVDIKARDSARRMWLGWVMSETGDGLVIFKSDSAGYRLPDAPRKQSFEGDDTNFDDVEGLSPVDQRQVVRALTGIPRTREPVVRGPDAPKTDISWCDALVFCRRHGYTLPTEAQWEYAASGPENRVFSWGDDINPSLAQLLGDGPAQPGNHPRDTTWCGVVDMTGNVAEWCLDRYARDLSWASGLRDPYNGDKSAQVRSFRGGWFTCGPQQGRDSFRMYADYRMRAPWLGFRPVIAGQDALKVECVK